MTLTLTQNFDAALDVIAPRQSDTQASEDCAIAAAYAAGVQIAFTG